VSRDLRKYARKTHFLLIVGFLFLIFVVGEGLIYLFYGQKSALMGLLCLLGGLIPVVSILIFFWFGKKILQKYR